jgi:outer membrane receptor protein involved in Fe transport
MQEEDKPWHMPNFVAKTTIWYSLQNKIVLKSSIYYEGKRDIKLQNLSSTQIDGVFDINLGIEYRYNKRASAFIDINNLTANRYHVWYLYPAQRFQVMLGVTYAL